jgi:prevent-host-death family protein
MAMIRATVSEAKAQLSRLIESALQGEEIVITRSGKAVVRLSAIDQEHSPRNLELGFWRGAIEIADDFDAPLPDDVLDAFEVT